MNNLDLYKRAFIHKSYCKRPAIENEQNGVIIAERPDNCMTLKTKSNERLEFLGDGVLECITKYYLYRRFPKANEGFMTEKKIALVKNESIGRMAYEMGLNKWYIMSKNAEEKKTRTNLKKLGCLFESFLGALFLENASWLALELVLRDARSKISKFAKNNDMQIENRMAPGYTYPSKINRKRIMWELEEQKILFGLFDKESISIRLTDSCTMLPRMSRSGIFGLKKVV